MQLGNNKETTHTVVVVLRGESWFSSGSGLVILGLKSKGLCGVVKCREQRSFSELDSGHSHEISLSRSQSTNTPSPVLLDGPLLFQLACQPL